MIFYEGHHLLLSQFGVSQMLPPVDGIANTFLATASRAFYTSDDFKKRHCHLRLSTMTLPL